MKTIKKTRMLWIGFGIVVVGVCYLGWRLTARSAYESAEYAVVRSDGAFEIREYPDLMLASTSMIMESEGDDGSFGRLFGFISGENETQQSVSMTTPVFMEREAGDSEGQMAFVIPKEVSEKGIPEPSNGAVRIRERSGGTFAVVRFAGRISSELTAEKERELRDWMADEQLSSNSSAEVAGYDPPWTPGPFRRNELLIRVSDP